ncbi:hypothetical protein BDB01DRAFT_800879 [Pilobolus umbonatus]|nr:hypothetical protein BDB01DRAFT_800879 [Pilobolus umbonatus]
MDTLPTEIIEWIAKHLRRKDIHTCINVNSQYYSIFIKYLYREVVFTKNDKLKLFLESLVLYPRYKNTGNYVRKFSTCIDYTSNKCPFENYTNTKIVSFLTNLPNIEEMSIRPTDKLIQALTNTRKPILTKVKSLNFEVYYLGVKDKLADCYAKYRSTLTNLTLNHPEFTDEELTSYLSLFPHVQNLHIFIREFSKSIKLDFTEILKASPTLNFMECHCISMNLNHLQPREPLTYPLKHLELYIKQMDVQDLQYIRDTLPELKFLDLNIESSTGDTYDFVAILLEMKSLDSLNIRLPGLFELDKARDYMNHLKMRFEEFTEPVINELVYHSPYEKRGRLYNPDIVKFMQFSTKYHPNRHVRTITTCIDQPYPISMIFDDLAELGGEVDRLDLTRNNHNSVWTLENINRRCSKLTELNLSSLKISPYIGLSTANMHLTSLTLKECRIGTSALKQIDTCCPMLQLLNMENIHVLNDGGEREIHYIDLPVSLLKIIHYEKEDAEWNRIVLRVVGGYCVKSWNFNMLKKRMIISEDPEDMMDIQPLKTGPLFVFICSSVKHVTLRRI